MQKTSSQQYCNSATAIEFAKWNMRRDDDGNGAKGIASLMASAHVDGSIRVYKFSSFAELDAKKRECKADLVFRDHFYAANQATFATNLTNHAGENLAETSQGVGGP